MLSPSQLSSSSSCILIAVIGRTGSNDANRFGAEKYTGGRGGASRNFPGVDENVPLVIPHNMFTVRFISDARYFMSSSISSMIGVVVAIIFVL